MPYCTERWGTELIIIKSSKFNFNGHHYTKKTQLTRLDISAIYEGLESNPALTHLHLDGNHIDRTSVEGLEEGLGTNQHLLVLTGVDSPSISEQLAQNRQRKG